MLESFSEEKGRPEAEDRNDRMLSRTSRDVDVRGVEARGVTTGEPPAVARSGAREFSERGETERDFNHSSDERPGGETWEASARAGLPGSLRPGMRLEGGSREASGGSGRPDLGASRSQELPPLGADFKIRGRSVSTESPAEGTRSRGSARRSISRSSSYLAAGAFRSRPAAGAVRSCRASGASGAWGALGSSRWPSRLLCRAFRASDHSVRPRESVARSRSCRKNSARSSSVRFSRVGSPPLCSSRVCSPRVCPSPLCS